MPNRQAKERQLSAKTRVSMAPAPSDISPQFTLNDDGTDQAQDRIERLLTQNTQMAEDISHLQAEVARLRGAESQDNPEIEHLRAEVKARFAEIAWLTQRLEAKSGAEGAQTVPDADFDALRTYAAELEFRHLTVLSSSTWRMGAPIRGMLRFLRGQPSPEPFAARYLDFSK